MEILDTRKRSVRCLERAIAFILHGQFLSRMAALHSDLKEIREINIIFIFD